jgi:hypothetical protein
MLRQIKDAEHSWLHSALVQVRLLVKHAKQLCPVMMNLQQMQGMFITACACSCWVAYSHMLVRVRQLVQTCKPAGLQELV